MLSCTSNPTNLAFLPSFKLKLHGRMLMQFVRNWASIVGVRVEAIGFKWWLMDFLDRRVDGEYQVYSSTIRVSRSG